MNNCTLVGVVVRDPEVRYSQSADPIAVARYTVAVKKSYVREGEKDANFFQVVVFGKRAEFAEKYIKKGRWIALQGEMELTEWEDAQKVKHRGCELHPTNQQLIGGKKNETADQNTFAANTSEPSNPIPGFTPTNFDEDDDLPF